MMMWVPIDGMNDSFVSEQLTLLKKSRKSGIFHSKHQKRRGAILTAFGVFHLTLEYYTSPIVQIIEHPA